MARSIEVRQQPQKRGLVVYAAPLAQVTPALRFATKLRQRSREFAHVSFAHVKGMVSHVREQREKLLPLFGQSNAASSILWRARCEELDRKTSSVMVGT